MFKDKLKEYRKDLGLSQEELGKKIFVSRSAVAKWEQGRGMPNDQSMQDLANLFEVSVEDLYNYEDITHLKKRYKGLKIASIISIAILFVISLSLGLYFIFRKDDSLVYGSFFKKSTLEKYHLSDYAMPYLAERQGLYEDDVYVCIIESESFALEYIKYTFDYLLKDDSLQTYFFVDGDVNLQLEAGQYNKEYYVKTTLMDDCRNGYSSFYYFYYTYEFDSNHIYYLSIGYGSVSSDATYPFYSVWEMNGDVGELIYGNRTDVLSICLKKIPLHYEYVMFNGAIDVYDHYLCDENQLERIKLYKDNFMEYFDWDYSKYRYYNKVKVYFLIKEEWYSKYYNCKFLMTLRITINGITYEEKCVSGWNSNSIDIEIDNIEEINSIEIELVSVDGIIYNMIL